MMFKGAQLGLCQSATPCHEIDGVWYAPLGVLVGYIGGAVTKEKGKIIKEKANELVKLAKEKGTPVLEKAAEEVREKSIVVVKEVLDKLENPKPKKAK
jgi:hypothetical protein